ncbi:amidohydrolase family protein [Streptomyces lydicus]|uniref:amidohydrolase family protein n=1 Tax=Streptomyces lydicus TaxID=47763 RepID=UPI0037AFBEE5
MKLSRRRVLAGLGGVPLAAATGVPVGRRDRPAAPEEAPGSRRTTLLRGADLVLTMDPRLGEGPLGTLENGVDLLLRHGAIEAVGRRLDAPPGARVVDAGGKIVLPGFVDLHNHLWQAALRGGCATSDLHGWLSGCNRATLPRIDARDMYRFVHLAALDALQAGVTTVVDWVHPIPYATSEAYVRALDDAGPRFVYAACQNAADLALVTDVKKNLLDPLPLASAQVAVHAGMTVRDELRQCRELARDLGVMLNSHVLEHRDDRRDDPIRALREDAGIHPTLPAVLRMATLGGAECLGMADRIGSLTPGKRADVVVLDPGTLNFAPRFDWTSQIVLNGQPPNVSEVYVDGYLRKSRGELLHVDTARVVREAERAAARVRAA